jgi:RNA-binding protein
MTLSGKDRAALRAEAHHLTPLVHVGHQGLSPTLLASLEDALRTRELVKVQLARTVEQDAREAAGELASATGADVVQVIGRTATLYRHNPQLERKRGDPPPWRAADR